MSKKLLSLAVSVAVVGGVAYLALNKADTPAENAAAPASVVEKKVEKTAATLTSVQPQDVLKSYSQLVYLNYKAAYDDAVKLQDAINAFLEKPNAETLATAREVWTTSRLSYGQTEAFRFYEGPIDFVKEGKEGPEGRLNAWPLNEAYIDYVDGNANAGIINDKSVEITEENIAGKNQQGDEADVSTGYHAIEFLLWGQDLSAEGPGNRPASDYNPGEGNNDRRRQYLTIVTNLLVKDLAFLVDSWKPDTAGDYAAEFAAQDPQQGLSKILTSLATLSGFELASERMATALDSGDQEDEHSCFSDTTHNDFIYNIKGIVNVYNGTYGDYQGTSIGALLKEKSPELAEKISAKLKEVQEAAAQVPHPIDQQVLATEAGSAGRQALEKVVTSLQNLADLFKEAGKALGVEVEIQRS